MIIINIHANAFFKNCKHFMQGKFIRNYNDSGKIEIRSYEKFNYIQTLVRQ